MILRPRLLCTLLVKLVRLRFHLYVGNVYCSASSSLWAKYGVMTGFQRFPSGMTTSRGNFATPLIRFLSPPRTCAVSRVSCAVCLPFFFLSNPPSSLLFFLFFR